MDYYQLLFSIGDLLLSHFDPQSWYTWTIPKPYHKFFENFWSIVTRKCATATALKNWYTEFKHGIYEVRTQLLVINDPELIEDVIIRDFSSFMERGFSQFDKIFPCNN
ncbi:hypothetical protein K0M31_009901 [Melipona bicolor]|uniref:Uncharacterized protein n=1 Tax=Melipona bicolor TaxID=60889 RepID=A0AA40KJ14_9HYME|nr:hypothetical protein K0M31_009901 [Melipona bicolor]